MNTESRVQKFRKIRKNRNKMISVVVIFLLFVLIGISVSDYSINALMNNQTRIEMVQQDNSAFVFNFLNHKIYLKKDFLNVEFQQIKKLLGLN